MDFNQNYHTDESQSDKDEQPEESFTSNSEYSEGAAPGDNTRDQVSDNTQPTPESTEVTANPAHKSADSPESGANGTHEPPSGMETGEDTDTQPMTGAAHPHGTEPETTQPQGVDDVPPAEVDAEEEEEIPPVRQIRDLLTDFEIRVPVWGITVFTVDGYILAHRLFYDDMPQNIEMAVSSMSAGLITISEDFIRLVDSSADFSQVLVDAEHETGDVSFSILLKHIEENVMLTCIFPSDTKLGLVSFEIQTVSNKIQEIVEMWDVKLHRDTMT